MESSRPVSLMRLLWVVGALIAEGVWAFKAPSFLAGGASSRLQRPRSVLRMAAEGTGPYKGPSSYPLLDSVRYPHDMKAFNKQVCATLLSGSFTSHRPVHEGVERPVHST